MGTRTVLHRRGVSPAARRRAQRGAVIVEAAFVFPIVVLLTFAIVEFGMLFGNTSTTSAASRSGARLTSTHYAGSGDHPALANQVAQRVLVDLRAMSRGRPIEMWIFKANSGKPTSCSDTTNCIRYTYNQTTRNWNTASGGWAIPDACGDNVDVAGVWVESRHPFLTNLFGSERIIEEQTTMRLEPLPSDQCAVISDPVD